MSSRYIHLSVCHRDREQDLTVFSCPAESLTLAHRMFAWEKMRAASDLTKASRPSAYSFPWHFFLHISETKSNEWIAMQKPWCIPSPDGSRSFQQLHCWLGEEWSLTTKAYITNDNSNIKCVFTQSISWCQYNDYIAHCISNTITF